MDYIYTSPSLSKELCERIIQRYDAELNLTYHGITSSGLDKNIKDTRDRLIPDDEEWYDINDALTNELEKHMKLYLESIESGMNYKKEHNYGVSYHHLQETLIQVNNFMIQRYEKNKGKYVYHHDGSNEEKHSRAVTYLWYLNDVEEGGETDFFGGTYQVKPETGKLLLFPACWAFPHRGNMPISSSKYIITGWLYTQNKQSTPKIPKISIQDAVTVPVAEFDVSNIPQPISTVSVASESQKLIFEYFYKENRFLFQDYKHKIQTNERLFQSFTIQTYTEIMSEWLKSKMPESPNRTDVSTLDEIRPFVFFSFKILADTIKELYQINGHFNIKEWYILNKESEPFTFDYDLCVQTELTQGTSYISTKYKEMTDFQIVYFIEFTFHYVGKDNETKILTIKEIADPCLELI